MRDGRWRRRLIRLRTVPASVVSAAKRAIARRSAALSPRTRYWLFEARGYRDVWLVVTTGMALWAVLLTFATANETHKSLCALRADLDRRVESGRTFLNSHPNGAFGFSRAQIVKGIADQQRTVQALRNLSCE